MDIGWVLPLFTITRIEFFTSQMKFLEALFHEELIQKWISIVKSFCMLTKLNQRLGEWFFIMEYSTLVYFSPWRRKRRGQRRERERNWVGLTCSVPCDSHVFGGQTYPARKPRLQGLGIQLLVLSLIEQFVHRSTNMFLHQSSLCIIFLLSHHGLTGVYIKLFWINGDYHKRKKVNQTPRHTYTDTSDFLDKVYRYCDFIRIPFFLFFIIIFVIIVTTKLPLRHSNWDKQISPTTSIDRLQIHLCRHISVRIISFQFGHISHI